VFLTSKWLSWHKASFESAFVRCLYVKYRLSVKKPFLLFSLFTQQFIRKVVIQTLPLDAFLKVTQESLILMGIIITSHYVEFGEKVKWCSKSSRFCSLTTTQRQDLSRRLNWVYSLWQKNMWNDVHIFKIWNLRKNYQKIITLKSY